VLLFICTTSSGYSYNLTAKDIEVINSISNIISEKSQSDTLIIIDNIDKLIDSGNYSDKNTTILTKIKENFTQSTPTQTLPDN
jgi:hypothetical protein